MIKVFHHICKDVEGLKAIPDGSQLLVMGTKMGKELKKTTDAKFEAMIIEEPKKI